MELIVNPSSLNGEISIPGSKSHTIRAVVIALLADGNSTIYKPLESADTLSCLNGCRLFGAEVEQKSEYWQIRGVSGKLKLPKDIVDVGNSGTTMNFLAGTASLLDDYCILTGDHQIKRRPSKPLLDALTMLDVLAVSVPKNGCPPLIVKGPLKGGYAEVRGKISQYLSSLLINCPLAPFDTEIKAFDLGEKPYVEMTLNWLDKQKIVYDHTGLEKFSIKGGQSYQAFSESIPADFSSATFFICAAAIQGCDIILKGLDFSDQQGDKRVVQVLQNMGADIQIRNDGLHVKGSRLEGSEIDLSDMPDALPALAVAGCLAKGVTRIKNVEHARLKETDRIAAMCSELKKMGADISEQKDGLLIQSSRLTGQLVQSYKDHRIAMALAIAGLAAKGTTTICDADAVNITFPQFPYLLRQLGASIDIKGNPPLSSHS